MKRAARLAALASLGGLLWTPAVDGKGKRAPQTKPPYSAIAEIDPANPKGVRLRRARKAGEAWNAYFAEVFLWPYDREHYNRIFTTLNRDGRKVQFIADTLFLADGHLHLILRGQKDTMQSLVPGLTLHTGDGKIRLSPAGVTFVEDPAGGEEIGIVSFASPTNRELTQWQSAFAFYGQAGGVAQVRSEAEAAKHYAMLRDFAEVAAEIYQQELKAQRPR
ncbi:MAG: hypothetical protein C0518_12385 [Opitutus sp.]|nr:hypothetical protein [Opitutus sp.]